MKNHETASDNQESQAADNGWEELADYTPENDDSNTDEKTGAEEINNRPKSYEYYKAQREQDRREFMKERERAEAEQKKIERERRTEADFAAYGVDGFVFTNLQEKINEKKEEYDQPHDSATREHIKGQILSLKEEAVEYGKARDYCRGHKREEGKKTEEAMLQAEKKMKKERYAWGKDSETTIGAIKIAAHGVTREISRESCMMAGLDERHLATRVKKEYDEATERGNKKRSEAMAEQLKGLGYDSNGFAFEGDKQNVETDYHVYDLKNGETRAFAYSAIRLALANKNLRGATKKAMKQYGVKKLPSQWDGSSVTTYSLKQIAEEVGLIERERRRF